MGQRRNKTNQNYLEINENKNQNVWDAAKSSAKRKYIAVNACICKGLKSLNSKSAWDWGKKK